MSNVDLLAALRPQQVTVTCCGRRWDLEAHSAAQWLGAIAVDLELLTGVLPGLVHDDDLEEMAEYAKLADIEDRWKYAARVAVGRAGGRDWWWTVNLCRKALPGWQYINGLLLREGVRAASETFPDWIDACYMLLWERGDENTRTALDLELSMPPAGVGMSKEAKMRMLAAFAAD